MPCEKPGEPVDREQDGVFAGTANLGPAVPERATHDGAGIRSEDRERAVGSHQTCRLGDQPPGLGRVLHQIQHRDRVELAVFQPELADLPHPHLDAQLLARVVRRPAVQVNAGGVPAAAPSDLDEEARAGADVEQASGLHIALQVTEDLRELPLDVRPVREVVAGISAERVAGTIPLILDEVARALVQLAEVLGARRVRVEEARAVAAADERRMRWAERPAKARRAAGGTGSAPAGFRRRYGRPRRHRNRVVMIRIPSRAWIFFPSSRARAR